jgi:hypothetical protein
MRIAAVVWLAAAVLGVALALWQQSFWDAIEAGAELDDILERVRVSVWLHHATHFLSAATIAVAASAWARGRMLVRIGQGLLALTLLVGAWVLLARMGQSSLAAGESFDHVVTINAVVFFIGLAALLWPTRAPLAARVGFVVLAAAWLLYLHVIFDAEAPHRSMWLFSAAPLLLAACWSAGLWFAATHEIDTVVEATAGTGVDDPSRLRTADGIGLLRVGIIARIVLSIASVAMLVALREDAGAASMVVWLGALGQCVLAAVIATALTSYGSLPDHAVERGHVTTVVACLAIAAMLELYGAGQTAAMLDIGVRARSGDLWDIPRLSEIEAMQTRAQWVGRFATVVGIVAAVSLAISLRKTALWLDDFANGDRAATLAVLTILGGGGSGILVAVAQSGVIRDIGAMAAAMLAALTLAIAILVMWLRLLSGLVEGLRRVPPPT